MIRRLVAVLAIIGLSAAVASARGTVINGPSISGKDVAAFGVHVPILEAGATVDVDLSGVTTWDFEDTSTPGASVFDIGLLDPDNIATKITVVPATADPVNGVGWDVIQTTSTVGSGVSWGSEMVIGFDMDDDLILELTLTTSGTTAPVTMEPNSSGGVFKLADAGIPDLAHNGTVDLYFFETYDDNIDAPDGLFEAGSTITIQTVPEPVAMSLLLIAGLSGLALRRLS